LSVSLIGCGEKESEKPEETKQTNVEVEESKDEVKAVEEMKHEEKANTEETSDDLSQGIDLVKSIVTERPQTLRIVSETTSFNMTTAMTTYYDGDKTKVEIDVPNMAKSILIHIPSEEVMYQYVYGEPTGMKITGADKSSAEEMGLMVDTSLLAALKDGASDDIIARKEYLDEEEVIYIEATQSDEEMEEMLVKMWYSEKYATPLKYEVYVEETLMTEFKVTEINDNVNFNDDTFMPPSDVVFQEVDMDTMMNLGEEGE
jgi:outer membrane lipoprotein-sorting protein